MGGLLVGSFVVRGLPKPKSNNQCLICDLTLQGIKSRGTFSEAPSVESVKSQMSREAQTHQPPGQDRPKRKSQARVGSSELLR